MKDIPRVPLSPIGFKELPDGGTQFQVELDDCKFNLNVPAGADPEFMQHFAEDFLTEPDIEATKKAWADALQDCDVFIIVHDTKGTPHVYKNGTRIQR